MIEVDGYRIEPLSPDTWPAFVALVERSGGLFSGCWCTNFHLHPDPPERREIGNKAFKQKLVEEGRTHAALVFDGDEAVAWAQYGTVEELANIHHRKEWERTVVEPPDFRITCVFVDKHHRKAGLAAVAVKGALALIAEQGGGRVESYPHDIPLGKKMSSSFIYNGTRTMYDRLGFDYDRPKGQFNCVMCTVQPPAPQRVRTRTSRT
jgi:GNAT superfamily N-acetyltransferase